MANKFYEEPSVKVYGSLSELTQIFGKADGDFINNVDNNDTGSISISCRISPVTGRRECIDDPDGGGPLTGFE